ncbi:MAG: O-antigen ligase family protein [Lentisphaerae bacterium]|nr:O-antigen ligase family protein [Lentisphaerota bacterium]
MIAAQPEDRRDKLHFVPPLIFLGALFLIYPNRTLLFAPDWIIFAFSTASLSLFCAGACLFVPDRLRTMFRALPRWFKYAFLFFALIAALHTAKNFAAYSLADIARSFAYLTIPTFACLYRDELKKLLPGAMTLLWLVTLAQSFVEHIMLQTDILGGIPLNRNWNAALILISAPFAGLLVFRRADSILKRFLALLVIVLPSLYVILVCNSLAVYLAFPLALLLLFLMNGRFRKIIPAVCGGFLILATAAFFLCKSYVPAFRDYLEQDDRIAIYAATVNMIADAPVTGYGIPSFEQEFLPYIRTPEFFLREHATDRANHPHNHLLFMAAGMGLTGLAVWLTLWLIPVLLRMFRKEPDPGEKMLDLWILFAWLVLTIHGMFDLVLFQEPTNLLGLVFTGWIWAGVFKTTVQDENEAAAVKYGTALRLTGYILTGLALFMAACNLFSSIHFRMSHRLWLSGRQTDSQRHIRLLQLTAQWDNTHYYLYQSALRLPPQEALAMLDQLTETATPDFAHINLHRGRLLMLFAGRQQEAQEALFRDAGLYPLHIEALYNLWMYALFTRNPVAAHSLAGEINRRLKLRGLDAAIRDPFPAPQDAKLEGNDVDQAMTYKIKRK